MTNSTAEAGIHHPRVLQRLRGRLYPPRPDPFVTLCNSAAQRARRVLDVGCGRQPSVTQPSPIGRLLFGTDVSRDVAKNRGLDHRVIANGGVLPFADGSFDICIARWVIEHLIDPFAVFSEIYRVLVPGGRLLFVTSNLWFYAYMAARLIPNRLHPPIVRWATGRQEQDTFPTVYRANTRPRLRNILCRVGFHERYLMTSQQGPAYLNFSLPTFLMGWAYERLVNRFRMLEGLRQMLIGDFERPVAD